MKIYRIGKNLDDIMFAALRHENNGLARRRGLMRRALAALTGILLTAGICLPLARAVAATEICSVCGGEAIVLHTAADLLHLAHVVNGTACDCALPAWPADGCFVLDADIDLSAYPQWTPIGTPERPFTGHFDGAGHTVTFNTSWRDAQLAGLFGVVRQSTIVNLTVAGDISLENPAQNASAGAIAAIALQAVFQKCIVQADMVYTGDEDAFIGGAVGTAVSTAMTDCAAEGGSMQTGENMCTGGMIGVLSGSEEEPAALTGCVSTCNVAGKSALLGAVQGSYTLQGNLYSASLCATTTAAGGEEANPAGTLGIRPRDAYFLPGDAAKDVLQRYGEGSLPAAVSLVSSDPSKLVVADGQTLRPYDDTTDARDIAYEAWAMLGSMPAPPDVPRMISLGSARADIYATMPVITGVSLQKDGVAVTGPTNVTAQCGRTAAIRLSAQVEGAEKTPVQWECSLDSDARSAALTWSDNGAGELTLAFDQAITQAVTMTIDARSTVDPTKVSPVVTLTVEPVYVTGIQLSAPASAVLYAGGFGVLAQVEVQPADATVPGYEWVSGEEATTLVELRGGRLYAADTLPQPEMTLQVAARSLGKDSTGNVLRTSQSIWVTLRRPIAAVNIAQQGGEAYVGDSFTLSATAVDAQGQQPYMDGVSWASSDPSVATIDRDTGDVTILAPGEVTFTATSRGTVADGMTSASAAVAYTCSYPCTCAISEVTVNAQTIVMAYRETQKEIELETTVTASTQCLVPGHAGGTPVITGYDIGEINTCDATLDGDVLHVTRPGSLELLVYIELNGNQFVASVPCVVMQKGIQQELKDPETGVTATGVFPKATLQVEVISKPQQEFLTAAEKADKEGKFLQLYRITLERDDKELEWSGKVVLRIPIPEDFQDHQVRVFWVDGQTWEIKEYKPVTTEEGCWVFQADRMGFFLVTGRVVYHTITATCGLHGAITPEGQVQVVEGRNQAFRIRAEDGYRLGLIVVDGIALDSASSKYTFTDVMQDHTIHVIFIKDAAWVDTAMVSVAASGQGQVVPSGQVPVVRGQDQVFGFLPQAGYQLLYVMVDGKKVEMAGGTTYTLSSVEDDHQIVAVFGQTPTQQTSAASGLPPVLWWGMGGSAALLSLALFLLLRKK